MFLLCKFSTYYLKNLNHFCVVSHLLHASLCVKSHNKTLDEKDYCVNFEKIIFERRKALRMSIEDLAAETDLSPRTISNYELGVTVPSLYNVIKIISVLGLRLEIVDSNQANSNFQNISIDEINALIELVHNLNNKCDNLFNQKNK